LWGRREVTGTAREWSDWRHDWKISKRMVSKEWRNQKEWKNESNQNMLQTAFAVRREGWGLAQGSELHKFFITRVDKSEKGFAIRGYPYHMYC
jgi:hypothetical protein